MTSSHIPQGLTPQQRRLQTSSQNALWQWTGVGVGLLPCCLTECSRSELWRLEMRALQRARLWSSLGCETSQLGCFAYSDTRILNTAECTGHRKHHSDDTPNQSHRSARTGLPGAPGSIWEEFCFKTRQCHTQWAPCTCGKSRQSSREPRW